MEEPFVKPDELIIYSAVLEQFDSGQTFIERNVKCKKKVVIKMQSNTVYFAKNII